MMEAPCPPDWFVTELGLIDPFLRLEWDDVRAAYWLLSRRGTDPHRAEVVPYGLFRRDELDSMLLSSIRKGIRRRDEGVSIRQIMVERRALQDLEEERNAAVAREAIEDAVTREVDAANLAFRVFSQGDRGHVHGSRHEGMVPREYRRDLLR